MTEGGRRLTHLDESRRGADGRRVRQGRARSATATASGRVLVSAEVVALLRGAGVPKGDALAVARIAGIQAAKRTPDLVPLCHPIAIHGVDGRPARRRRRRRDHGDGPHGRPHRRRDGGADLCERRRADPGRHGQGRRPAPRSSPTCGSSARAGARSGEWLRTGGRPRRRRHESARRERVQPGGRRGLRGPHRSGARRGAESARASRSTAPRWCRTVTRSRRRCARRSRRRTTSCVTLGRHRHLAHRPHPRDDAAGARPRAAGHRRVAAGLRRRPGGADRGAVARAGRRRRQPRWS